jgi:3-oxoacyl-[acyl-carrier-protein] synthase II
VCGLPKVNPLWLLKYLPNMPNSHVSIYNDFRGPNNSITLREASMNLSVAEAASIIRRGAADVMLVGATGSRIHPLRAAIMTMTDRLAAETEDPAHMARPFDSTCDGIVLGEGAGALLLESAEHAERRGAKIWGEIIGEGSAMVGPRGNRDFLREAVYASMSSALNMAGKRLPKRWHLHAQGLSSPTADASEGKAIAQLLSQFEAIPVTAAKSYTGNLGAGSAAMELICSILALHHGQLFPIRNLSQPASYATWRPATLESEAGQAFLHSSYTLQGQTSSLVVAAA